MKIGLSERVVRAAALSAMCAVGASALGAHAAPAKKDEAKKEAPSLAPSPNSKTCQALFDTNRAMIEMMAEAGNTAGIRALYARAGCAEPTVSVEKRPAGKALSRFSCTAKLIPPSITCTFGIAAKVNTTGVQ